MALAPGKTVDLGEMNLGLRPATEKGNETPVWKLFGTGKFQLQCDKAGGNIHEGNTGPDPVLCKLATGKLELEVKEPEQLPINNPTYTVWGKGAGGLQAGLGLLPGAKRAYSHGETVTLVVRVRNVGKLTAKFEYVKQFLDENRPVVTDAGGKEISQSGTLVEVFHIPVKVTLEPGKEIVLETRTHAAAGTPYALMPEGGGLSTIKASPLFVGNGKFSLQYERVLGNSSSGQMKLSLHDLGKSSPGQIKFDPDLEKLATGKLELEIKADPPQQGADKPHVVEKPDMKGRLASRLPEKVERVGGEPTQEDIVVVSKMFFSKLLTYPDIRFREFFDPRYLKKHGLADRDIAIEVTGHRGISSIEVADDNRTVLCTMLTTKDSREVREIFVIRWIIHEGCLYVSPEKAPDPKTGIFTPWILRTKP